MFEIVVGVVKFRLDNLVSYDPLAQLSATLAKIMNSSFICGARKRSPILII